jgi:Glycosyltransferase 61
MLPSVTGFAEVAGVEVIEVQVPSHDRVVPRSHSVQSRVHPILLAERLKPIPPARVAIVPHGRLTGDSGAVVTSNGRLVLESLWDEPHWERSFNPPPRLPPAARLAGRHASLISLWSLNNFHHWMFEALPRLALLQLSGVSYDGLIVPEDLRPFQRETLHLMGVSDELLVPFRGNHVQPDELVWAAPLSPFEQPLPYAIDWLRRLSQRRPEHASDRIYLPRRHARRVANEPDVLRLLAGYGFRVVDPDTMDVSEQIQLFSTARFIVGSHGAAFSNGIFSHELTAIVLFQDHHVNISTTAALVAAGHEHWSLMCPRVPAPRRRRNQDLRASVRDLEETLHAVGLT